MDFNTLSLMSGFLKELRDHYHDRASMIDLSEDPNIKLEAILEDSIEAALISMAMRP